MDKRGSQQSGGEPKNPMTQEAASRIQSSEANNMAVEWRKEALLRVLSPQQTSMKTKTIRTDEEDFLKRKI